MALLSTLLLSLHRFLVSRSEASEQDRLVFVLVCVLAFMVVILLPYIFISTATVSRLARVYQRGRVRRKIALLRIPKKCIRLQGNTEFALSAMPTTRCPLICFINPRSGGQLGEQLFQQLRKHLSPYQVFDIALDRGPQRGLAKVFLESARRFQNCRVLACGGDGTVGWVLSTLDRFGSAHNMPPVAVLPLGTGNDMARTLGWGGSFEDTNEVASFLAKVSDALPVPLDRWKITIRNAHGVVVKDLIFNNYFSLGIDATIVRQFHEARETNPEKFTSALGNKWVYAKLGAESALFPGNLNNVRLQVSAMAANSSTLQPRTIDVLPEWKGLIVCNLPNYQAGHDFWGVPDEDDKEPGALSDEPSGIPFRPVNISDGLLEVMSVAGSLHMAAIHTELFHANRLAQCHKVEVRLQDSVDMQADGEPWHQPGPCVVTITHFRQSLMLEARGHSKVIRQPTHFETETETETETEAEM
eukprot:TRINITY_DN7052_c0_g1_i1.p1 TRINITY_DN7052_c0_g1~~TRINITY_DN7052_c0_g1_i1.p1  ORF type:complete len:472 (-),score=105.16 TRINITY_DN7052_c0_g1_i1:9-1424(-)